MRNLVLLAALVGIALTVSFGFAAKAADDEKPKHTIKQVMKEAHKDGLLKKVLGDNASDEEKKTLVVLYTSLSQNKPKKGDAESWKKLTSAIVAAAKEVAEGGETAKLQAATNCGACHKVHK